MVVKKIIFLTIFLSVLLLIYSGCSKLSKPTQGAFYSVNHETCIGCRNCVKVCNADAIVMISGKAVIDPTKCNECAKCINICPVDAIE